MVAVAVVAAVIALGIALIGSVEARVVADEPGGVVQYVEPGSFAWHSGIRPGQRVVALRPADEPRGWAIDTESGGIRLHAEVEAQTQLLRTTAPLALVALGAAIFAAARLSTRPRMAEAAAAVAVAVATVPWAVQAGAQAPWPLMALAAIVPAAWLSRWAPYPRSIRLGLGAAVGGLVGLWLAGRVAADPRYLLLEEVRGASSIGLAGLVAFYAADLKTLRTRTLERARIVDVLSIILLIAAATASLVVLRLPAVWVGLGTLLALVSYRRLRRLLLEVFDRALISDLRERMTIGAAEAERARLARDLHDAPLQQITGIIRRLELVPGARAEGDALRELAEQLRSVATRLYPPLLDEYGLAPALEFLVEQTRAEAPHFHIRANVEERAGQRDPRPPSEVEVAMFRIAEEALRNAVRHSRGKRIVVRAAIDPHEVELVVADDGSGIEVPAAKRALRAGHLGIASMQRRADAIGAQLKIAGSSEGSSVAVSWRA